MHTRNATIRLWLAGLAIPALAASAGTAHAQFSFDAAASVAAGTQPGGIASGDFDNDGDQDLATTVDGPERIVVLLNDGTGSYTVGPSSPLPASSSPQDIVAGRLDGDLIDDLAVAIRDPAGAVMIMINNGAGSFTSSGSIAVGDRPRGMAIADIDNDLDMDLAVANRDSGTAHVLTNDGTGSFTASPALAVGGEARATAFGDFDNDLDKDLAVTNADLRTVQTFRNDGGTFVAAMTLSVGGVVRPDGITAALLDGDLLVDIAVAVSDQTLGVNQAMVFLNNGAGFTAPVGYDTGGTNTSDIVAADLDCDGLNDLATVNADSNDVSMLRNAGAGVFGTAQVMAVGTGPGRIVASDHDGDGDDDLAVDNRDSNDVSVMRNQTCTACPWDTGGDGMVGINDLLDLLAAWGPNPGHPADFDGSGAVDVVDLLALLANWGGCP